MHQDWQIEQWEEKNIYIHIQLAHLEFGNLQLPHWNQVGQVAFPVKLRSVLLSTVCVSVVQVYRPIRPRAWLLILYCAILAKKVNVHVIFAHLSPVSLYHSLYSSIPRWLNSLLPIFWDFGMRLLDYALCFLNCSTQKHSFGCLCHFQDSGKNNLMRQVTHREAVLRSVIHSILDVWHYKVLWTCALTWLLWYACNYVRLILYIMLHSTNLKPSCQMHFFARSQVYFDVHSWLHSTVHSQSAWLTLSWGSQVRSKCPSKYSSENSLKYTLRYVLQDALNCTRWLTPSLLDCTIPSKLSRRSQAHSRACSHVHSQLRSMTCSQPAWLYAPK